MKNGIAFSKDFSQFTIYDHVGEGHPSLKIIYMRKRDGVWVRFDDLNTEISDEQVDHHLRNLHIEGRLEMVSAVTMRGKVIFADQFAA